MHCPWCFNHYVSLIGVLVYVDYSTVWDVIAIWFACTAIGGLVHFVLLRAYEPIAKMTLMRQLDKQKKKYETKKDQEATESSLVKHADEPAQVWV